MAVFIDSSSLVYSPLNSAMLSSSSEVTLMYISSNDLKIYNLILVVFSSIDDSFSCVSRQARRNIWGQWGFVPAFFWQIFWPYSNERGEVYAHQIGMSPFSLKKFCRTFVSEVCLPYPESRCNNAENSQSRIRKAKLSKRRKNLLNITYCKYLLF